MSRPGSNGPAPGRRPAPPPNPPAPVSVRMWWDGGDRAITAREKATIEEHGPSCFSIPLVHADAPQPAELAEQQSDARSLAEHITNHLCHHEYDIGGRSELLACVAAALAAHQPGAQVPVAYRARYIENGRSGAWVYYTDCPAREPDREIEPLYAARQPVGNAEQLDRALGQTIDQRDRYHEVADDLAAHIERITGVEIGEHSSENCPWQNAIDAAEAYQPAQGIDLRAISMESAPRDGTMLRLLVQFTDHATEDTDGAAWTIGANNHDRDDEDVWKFAGWCWAHDHFTEGKGTPVGWLPLIDDQRDAAPGVGNG